MSINPPTTRGLSLGVDRHHYALDAKSFRRFTDQLRSLDRRRVHTHFVCSRQQHIADVDQTSNATPNRKRHKALFGSAFDNIDHCSPVIRTSGDIKKNQLVSTLPIVLFCAFYRITRIPELYKFRALYDAALGYIEARNDSFGKHAGNDKSQMTDDK
jgi:hypothetical protein